MTTAAARRLARGAAPGRRVIYRRAPLYAKQEAALFSPARIVCIEATTKGGKTTGSLVWLTEQVITTGAPGRRYWWIAPVYKQAKIAYDRFLLFFAASRGVLWDANDSDLTVTFAHGPVLEFRSAEKPDNLYGDDVFAIVFDEASRARREAWAAVVSVLTATGGPVRLIGNVRGRRNFFFELSRRAQACEDGSMAHFLITADDAVAGGVMSPEAIAFARDNLPEAVFLELYYGIASDDGGNPFGLEHILRAKRPPTGREVVVWGIDLAKRVDYTTLVGLDAYCAVARVERFRVPYAEALDRIRRIVGTTSCVVDATGVGDPVCEMLRRPAAFGNPTARPLNVTEFVFTANSKQRILERLAVSIQNGTTTVPDKYAASEYEPFEFEVTRSGGVRYGAPEGFHDDVPIAHALALEGFDTRTRGGSVGGGSAAL